MKTFAKKVFEARSELSMSQKELGEAVGISSRSVFAYENGEKKPRTSTIIKLAKALKVSVKFLSDDNCENPVEDIEKDGYIEQARKQLGHIDADFLLKESTALFAGGELSMEEKEEFFNAVMKAYIVCKENAKEKYGKK